MAAGPVARAAVCSKGVDGWTDKRRLAGGTGPNILPSNDVRFRAHNGLMADIRLGPFCADSVAKVFLRHATQIPRAIGATIE